MAIVNKSLNLLDEKKLTEKVRKYTALYYKSDIAKKFEFFENVKIIFSNVSTLISQNTSQWLYLNLVTYRRIPGLGKSFLVETLILPDSYVLKARLTCILKNILYLSSF